MVWTASLGDWLKGLAGRTRAWLRRSHESAERELRGVLDESADPICCAAKTVEHIRRLIPPESSGPASPR